MEKISMAGPWITDFEKTTILEMMDSGWDNYRYVEKFEAEFAKWHNRNFCLMTPNCTQAIHLILLALGIADGEEVIVPDCTWTGTSAPITYANAIPVFADISRENWCLDPISVINRITSRTRAILAVDLYGNMADWDSLQSIGETFGIPIIEDAAEALGSTLHGIRAGKFGVAGVHSFHRTKTMTTGEGGALLIDDPDLYERAKFLRDHGRSSSIPYYTLEATPKYMPSNLQAALAWAQFQRIDELIDRKREIFHRYKHNLRNIDGLQFNNESDKVYNGVWATTVVFDKKYRVSKLDAIERLSNLGVPARPFFYPLSSLPAYVKYNTGDISRNPVAYDISSRGITLACDYRLSDRQIDFICDGIRKILR